VSFQSRFHILAGRESAGDGLLPALALSIALHGLMLWPEALPRLALQAGRPLTATLRAAPAVESPAAPAVEKTAEKPAPGRVAAALAAPAPNLPPPSGEGGSASVAAVVGPLAPGGGAESRNPAARPGEPAGPDADGLRAYRIVLAREARAHRHYPPLARERGWTGTAEISVDVSREGQARQILLARSSGHEVLDREAVNMMSRAAASAVLPDSLRGREFAVRLPVVFDLDDRL
jgi:protein TonB